MTIENMSVPSIAAQEDEIVVPWAVREVLFGIAAAVLLSIGVIWIAFQTPDTESFVMMAYELAYLFPVVVILLVKKAKPEAVGLRPFKMKNLTVGCGLLLGTYLIILVHNLLLMSFGIAPQGETLTALFGHEYFGMLVFVGVVVAPLVEEIFFRGFVFGGLRQKYGWKAATLLSSGLFAIAHLQLVALIPTFLMGIVLTYLYHRSKSIWPGIILHFIVNSFAFGAVYFVSFLETLV